MDVHEEIRKEAMEEERGEKPKWHKVVALSGAMLMVLLLMFYIFGEPIKGLAGSSRLEEGVLETEGLRIQFEGGVLKVLQKHYAENEHREIKACLSGRIEGLNYIIEGITFPEVVDASVVHIRAGVCPASTIIDLHSHPISQCGASEQDLEVFGKLKKSSPDLLMAIMCSNDRFRIYQNT